MKTHLLLPLLSSVLYIAAALFLKRAQQLGAGVLRTTFVSNLLVGLVFAALLPLGGPGGTWADLWEPALVAALFIGGQACTFLALSRGDVSIATPVLGAKTIFVAWFTTLLLATRLPWPLWAAAALSFLAIALLHRRPASSPGGARHGHTIGFSLLAAAAYALFDVLVQKWAPAWGAGRFLPITFALSVVLSVGFVPFFREPLRALPRAAWPALGAGALFMALQSFALVCAVAMFGDATAINVVYSARGVWSVIAVWLVGHWFANAEGQLGAGALRWRLAGAALMTAAIVIVVAQ